jgi:hypothetical protein
MKQKVYALAQENDIEIYVGWKWDKWNTAWQINLPKGYELPNGQTGFSGDLNTNISAYKNWKFMLGDLEELINQKSVWRKISVEDVEEGQDV